MRVLHILTDGLVGGITSHVHDLAVGQKKAGAVVRVLSCAPEGEGTDRIRAAGVPVTSCEARSGHDIRLPVRLGTALRAADADVIHLHSLPLFGVPAVWWSRAVALATIHSVGFAPRDRFVLKAYEASLDGAIALSTAVPKRFRAHRLWRSVCWATVPNGVDLSRFAPAAPAPDDLAERLRLGILGRLERDKHVGEALRATALLRRDGIDATLDVIGDGSRAGALRREARRLDLGRNVRFLGKRQDVPDCLRALDLLLVTSKAETFCLVALEAMATGLPVVAYPMEGGVNDWIHDRTGALVCNRRTPSALARAAASLAGAPAAYRRLARRGRATARTFSLERTVRRTLGFYRLLLAADSRRATGDRRAEGEAPAPPVRAANAPSTPPEIDRAP